MIKRLIMGVAVFLCTEHLLRAQSIDMSCKDACCCSRPDYHAPVGIMLDHSHHKGTWMVSYQYMQMRMQGNIFGSDAISQEEILNQYLMGPDKMRMEMHMVMLMYGLTNHLSLMVMSNYVKNSMDMSMITYGAMHMDGGNMMHDMEGTTMRSTSSSQGFSDPQFFLLYSLIDNEENQLVLGAGVGIPIGSIKLRGLDMNGKNQKLPYVMQTGSGSWRFLPAITFSKQFSGFSWGVQATADLKANYNKAGYKIGNLYSMSSWLGRKWNDWISNSIRISENFSGSTKGYDKEIVRYRTVSPDADTRNTGRLGTNVFVGMNFQIPKGILVNNHLGIEVGMPVYENVHRIQMKNKLFLLAGWQYLF